MTFLDRKTRSRLLAPTLAAVLLFVASVSPPSAQAEEPADSLRRSGEVAFDLAVLRPLWGVTLVIGSVLLAPAALMASPGGLDAIRDAREVFFDGPYKQTFKRPLGEI